MKETKMSRTAENTEGSRNVAPSIETCTKIKGKIDKAKSFFFSNTCWRKMHVLQFFSDNLLGYEVKATSESNMRQ